MKPEQRGPRAGPWTSQWLLRTEKEGSLRRTPSGRLEEESAFAVGLEAETGRTHNRVAVPVLRRRKVADTGGNIVDTRAPEEPQ